MTASSWSATSTGSTTAGPPRPAFSNPTSPRYKRIRDTNPNPSPNSDLSRVSLKNCSFFFGSTDEEGGEEGPSRPGSQVGSHGRDEGEGGFVLQEAIWLDSLLTFSCFLHPAFPSFKHWRSFIFFRLFDISFQFLKIFLRSNEPLCGWMSELVWFFSRKKGRNYQCVLMNGFNFLELQVQFSFLFVIILLSFLLLFVLIYVKWSRTYRKWFGGLPCLCGDSGCWNRRAKGIITTSHTLSSVCHAKVLFSPIQIVVVVSSATGSSVW